jgi:hypothetical protein
MAETCSHTEVDHNNKLHLRRKYNVACRLVARQQPRNSETPVVARQRPAHNNRSTIGSCVFCVVRSEAI